MKNNKTFYIFRHGLTPHVKKGIPYGDDQFTVSILPEAHESIEKIGKYLKDKNIDLFLTSELKRAQETAAIVSGIIDLPYKNEPLVNEMLEDFDAFRERIEKFVVKIKKVKEKNIAICTHGACISALKHFLMYDRYDTDDLMDFPMPGELWIIKDRKLEELDFNQ